MELTAAVALTLAIGASVFWSLHQSRRHFQADFGFLLEWTERVEAHVRAEGSRLRFRPTQFVIRRTTRGDLRITYRRSRLAFPSRHHCLLTLGLTVRYRPGMNSPYEVVEVADFMEQLQVVSTWLRALAQLPRRR